MKGRRRTTTVVKRTGSPVVLTTTTSATVFEDDSTRFLSTWADESPDQTLAVALSKASRPASVNDQDLHVWQAAMGRLKFKKGDFCNPPRWLQDVARRLPLDRQRLRRDWTRALSMCQAVALCRRYLQEPGEPLDITFADYCVAYKILEPVLASTLHELPTREAMLSQAVAAINRNQGRGATHQEVAAKLGWNTSLVYRHVPKAVKYGLLKYESETRGFNEKPFWATVDTPGAFLPRPRIIFDAAPELGPEVRYVDPFTGKRLVIRRK
jgi:hypothetical protein